jgi:hypothetical protein
MATDRYEIKSSKDGKSATVAITHADGSQSSMTLPVDVIGTVIIGLMGAATDCAIKTGLTASKFALPEGQTQIAYARATGVALGDTDTPDVTAFVLLFGQTQVGVGLHRSALRPLGTALMAATADLGKPQ